MVHSIVFRLDGIIDVNDSRLGFVFLPSFFLFFFFLRSSVLMCWCLAGLFLRFCMLEHVVGAWLLVLHDVVVHDDVELLSSPQLRRGSGAGPSDVK